MNVVTFGGVNLGTTTIIRRTGDMPGRAGLNGDGAHGFDRRAGTHIVNETTITELDLFGGAA